MKPLHRWHNFQYILLTGQNQKLVCTYNTKFVLIILSEVKKGKMKKSASMEQLKEGGLIDKDLPIAAKHGKLKWLLNSISVSGGSDNSPTTRSRM